MSKKLISAIVFSGFVLMALPARAFWALSIDSYPLPDVADNIPSTLRQVSDLSKNVKSLITSATATANNMKSAVNSVISGDLELESLSAMPIGADSTKLAQTGTLGSTLAKYAEAASPISTAHASIGLGKNFNGCYYQGKKYDYTSADSVYDLSKILFLQYPGDSAAEQQTYNDYRQKFYQDTLLYIYTAANQLQNELDNNIKASVEAAGKCISGDSSACDTPAPDGNNESLYIEGQALKTVNDLYKEIIKITALRAQLISAKAMYKGTPAPYVKELKSQTADTSTQDDAPASETNAAVMKILPVYAYSSSHTSSTLAFAQLGIAADNMNAATALSKVEDVAAGTDKIVDTSGISNNAFMFMTPPASPLSHPYVEAADKMAELEKIAPITETVEKAIEVHNMIYNLDGYKGLAEGMAELRERYKKALNALKIADKCAQNYIGRHYKNPAAVWGTRADVTDHDNRTGVSKMAYDYYQAAKAAETSQISADDISKMGSSDVDPDNVKSDAITSDEQADDILKLIRDSDDEEEGMDSSEAKSANEGRKSALLSWQIGAEVSKSLASEPQKWGQFGNGFPIWSDVKNFYNQYLDKKYANIKSYLTSFSQYDILAVAVENLSSSNPDISNNLWEKRSALVASLLSSQDKALAAYDAEAAKHIDDTYAGKIRALYAERKKALAELDAANDKLKQDTQKLSSLREKAKDDAGDAMLKSVTAQETFPDSITGDVGGTAPTREVSSVTDKIKNFNNDAAKNKESPEIAALTSSIKTQKSNVKALKKKLAQADKNIATARRRQKVRAIFAASSAPTYNAQDEYKKVLANIQNMASDTEDEYASAVKKSLQDILSQNGMLNTKDTVDLGEKITPSFVRKKLISSAGSALEELNEAVAARVDAARAQLAAMGDKLYDPANHQEVVNIHQNMIRDIKAMSVSIKSPGLSTISGINIFAKLLTADTAAETEGYFVGRIAKLRDVKAPKAIFVQKLPPLREVFHFDEVDFENVKPYIENAGSERSFIAEDFLDMGGEIPLVWKYMLQDKAFVETDIDFSSILDSGSKKCAIVSFLRGGEMPCWLKGSNLIIDINEDGNLAYRSDKPNGVVNECPLLEVKGAKVNHTLRNVSISTLSKGLSVKTIENAPDTNCQFSELGSLVEAAGTDGLQFRGAVYGVYFDLLQYDIHYTGKELSDSRKMRLAAVERSPYNSNQIGTFLVYAENENNIRDQVNELQKDYDAQMEELRNTLSKYGYELSKDINFANSDDYEQVRRKLDNIKNQTVADALQQIEGVDVEDNDVVAERVDSLKSALDALQKDDDELVLLNSSAKDINNLDEQIKSAKANKTAVNKYTKSLKENSASSKLSDAPYCATY